MTACQVCGSTGPRCTFGAAAGPCTCWRGTPCRPNAAEIIAAQLAAHQDHHARPAPLADPARCPGSLQTVLDAAGAPTPCPVCRAPIAAVPLDGRPVLAEHRRAAAEALPMALFA